MPNTSRALEPELRLAPARQSLRTALAMVALAAFSACGAPADHPPTATPPPAATPPTATTRAAVTVATEHDQYAAAGFTCEACHPCGTKSPSGHTAPWMDTTSSQFHAVSANASLASCQACHGAALDGVGGSTTVSCAQCHGATWKTTCTMCHGGADNQTGAPPKATWGNSADLVRVGAHTAHVGATHGLSAAIDCGACHVKPADALAAGHVDGAVATVAFSGLATQGVATAPAWNRTAATCTSTYCHGATLPGGTLKTPVWTTLDGSQRACTACHGAPPPAPHVQISSCGNCHSGYTATSVNAATHVDGKVDVAPMTCTSCHGAAGQTATAASPLYAAPPTDTSGAVTGLRVGAHQKHLAGSAATKKYSSGFPCQTCHPAVGTYTTTHSNGTTEVAFTGAPAASLQKGTWTPGTSTTAGKCTSTWCHGNAITYSGNSAGGTLLTPAWNGAVTACTACHGTPPSTGQHTRSAHVYAGCGACHPGYSSTSVNLSLHVNGTRNVGGTGTRINSWSASTRQCYPACHGSETW